MLPCYLCQFLVSCGTADPAKPLNVVLTCVATIDRLCSSCVFLGLICMMHAFHLSALACIALASWHLAPHFIKLASLPIRYNGTLKCYLSCLNSINMLTRMRTNYLSIEVVTLGA